MRRVLGILASVALTSCASSAYRAARDGDYARLRTELSARHERGKISNGDAACLARAVASHEVGSARGEAVLARLRDVRACAGELDAALAEVMQAHDAAGAEAALMRLEDGKLDEDDARTYLGDVDDRWRAVAARALHRDSDGPRRQRAMVDPSPRVRRSAVRAAAIAGDAADLDVLFECARLDPEPIVRSEAVRAMSAVARRLSSRDARRVGELATRLRDLWNAGDDALREDIAVAWALAPVFEHGGREALRVVIAEGGGGPGAIAAASVVLRTGHGGPRAQDELTASAHALLARSIGDGSRRARLHALAVAPLEGAELAAVRAAARDEDPEIRVAALGRLLEVDADRAMATRELERIAGQGVPGGPAEPLWVEQAPRARYALAAAGDVRIQAWIETGLTSSDAQSRLDAASALAALGRAARAAPLLTDADPMVRTRASCTMIMAARH